MAEANHKLSNGTLDTDDEKHVRGIMWRNVFILSFFHISAVYGLYLAATEAKWQTNLFVVFLYLATKVGVSAGVHRLWSHRSYKATLPLRCLLMVLFTIAFEGKVWVWARDHRVHHKHQETAADPYNAREGLWFSHVGWLLRTKHPAVLRRGRTVDMTDLAADPLVMFQKRYYWWLVLVLCFLIPTAVPVACWAERRSVSWHVAVCLRCVLCFHSTWVINSLAHAYGNRPYDKNLLAAENVATTWVTLGEGWHNYHHAFPWDYRTAEVGLAAFNLTKGFIDLCARLGLAHDLRTASPALVAARAARTGDGTRRPTDHDYNHNHKHDHEQADVWGWDDPELTVVERREATVLRPRPLASR